MSYVTRSGRRTNKVNYSDTQRSRTTSRSVTPQQVIQENINQDSTDNETEENQIEMNNTNDNDIIQEPPQKRQKISKTTSTSTANKPSPTNRRRRRRRPLRNKNKTKTSSSPLSTTTNTNNKPQNDEEEIKDEEEDENDSSEQDEDGDQVMDLTSFDSNRNNKNKNKNRKKKENQNKNKNKNKNKVPPSIQIPDLPTLEELEAMEISISPKENKKPKRKQRRSRPKKTKSTRKKTSRKSSKQELSSSDEDEDESSSSSDSDDLEILSPRKKRILPSLTPKKKTQKNKKKVTPKSKRKKEVRRARKRICSQQARDRIARARHQRLFMINAKIIDDYEREYAVLGSTGNVYTITISTLHNCTCPDFAKGNLCKHVMFVLLKVLRVPSNSEYVYQKALLTTELDEIFAAAPQTLFGTVMANANVRRKYKSTMGDDDDDVDDAGDVAVGNVERKPLEGDCPVCMEEIDDKEATTWCRGQCGNNVHVQCFKEWKKNALRDGTDVVCMFCRCEWIDGPEDGVKGGKKRKKTSGSGYNEGYLNLASEQGMSTVRDTSSYYQSGWRGYGRWYGGYRRSWY